MNVKTWIPLVLAVVLGLVALVIGRKAISGGGRTEATNTARLVVAARDVAPGRVLTAQDLSVGRVTKDLVPSRAFSDAKDLVGRTVVTPMVKGQAVVEPLLAPDGAGGGMQALVPAGMRAITLEVNEFSSVGGMLAPGCRVDLVASVRDERGNHQAARTVLQNIKVLAVGRQFNPNPPPPPENAPPAPPANHVTLLVTPKQAQVVQLAAQGGRPWLVLRNLRDVEVEADPSGAADPQGDPEAVGQAPTPSPKLDLSWLFSPFGPSRGSENGGNTSTPVEPLASNPPVRTPAVTPTRKAAPRVVKVIRGGVESEVTVPHPGGVSPGPQRQPAQPPVVSDREGGGNTVTSTAEQQ